MTTDVTQPPADPPIDQSAPAPASLPFWTRGDTNAFFGLGFNISGQRPDADRPDDRRRLGARQ